MERQVVHETGGPGRASREERHAGMAGKDRGDIPMVEVRGVGLALDLVSPQPQEVNILLVEDLTLLISCQGMAVSLQSLGGGQGGSTAAAGVCH